MSNDPNESRTRFAGEVLIQIQTKRAPVQYKKGHLAAAKPLFVAAVFKDLYEENKDNFEAALAPHFTDEGKVYFATTEGKEELSKFVEFVKTKKSMSQLKK